MIKSFGSKATETIWNGYYAKSFPSHIQQVARRKLRMINNAQDLNDLRVPPANRLEKLKGNLNGYHSIRINDQWRVIFKWRGGDAFDVEIVDYHG
jgi:proteic killer suppression protein